MRLEMSKRQHVLFSPPCVSYNDIILSVFSCVWHLSHCAGVSLDGVVMAFDSHHTLLRGRMPQPAAFWLQVRQVGWLSSRMALWSHGQCISLLFSHSIVSNSLWPRDLQHARLPYPSPSPRACQIHVYPVSDAIQPSHPLSSPAPPAFNLSQHQGHFQWVGSSHQVAKVLELQHQSFPWILRIDFF